MQAEPRPRRSPVLIVATIGIIVLLAAVAYGTYYWIQHQRYFETENAKVAGDLIQVSAKAAGRIASVKVTDGSVVKKGDLLAVLEDDLTQAQLAQAQAGLERARAERARVVGGAREQEIRRLEEAVAAAGAQRDLAGKAFEHTQALYRQGAASQFQFDQAQAQYRAAEAGLSQAQAALDGIKAGASANDLAVLDAAVKQAEAAVKLAQLAVDSTRVIAPADGTVALISVHTGEMAAPGVPLLTLVDLNHLRVDANVEETDIARIKAGEPVDVFVDAYPGRSIAGEVAEVGVATGSVFSLIPQDNSTGNFTKIVQRVPVRIKLAQTEPGLRPGMSVLVRVHLQGQKAVSAK